MTPPTVLHYLGYDEDVGGIVSIVRTLEGAKRFPCILGVNSGFVQHRLPALPTLELPAVLGETIGPRNFWQTRRAAKAVRRWLSADPRRLVHAHSRAGTLVAWWLARWGEARVVASLHCYGSQRWFYRQVHGVLKERLFFLSPAMRRYYGLPDRGWEQCIPGCVAEPSNAPRAIRPAEPLRLGGIGALTEWKRWDWILSALARLPASLRRRVRFEHIGASLPGAASHAYAQRLYGMTESLGLADIVTWKGAQPSSAPLLEEIDVLVVPSQNEPFSVAVLEALMRGVPVLAANSGGASDLVVPPENGWLFASDDANDLTSKITGLVEGTAFDGVSVDRAGLRKFHAPEVAEAWLRVYERYL